jgi:hypothetical protein
VTDPDAAMVSRGRNDSRPRYHHHRAIDDAKGVVTAVETTPVGGDGVASKHLTFGWPAPRSDGLLNIIISSVFAEGGCQNHLPSRLSTIHYLKPVSLFGFQKVCTSFIVLALVIPAQANL